MYVKITMGICQDFHSIPFPLQPLTSAKALRFIHSFATDEKLNHEPLPFGFGSQFAVRTTTKWERPQLYILPFCSLLISPYISPSNITFFIFFFTYFVSFLARHLCLLTNYFFYFMYYVSFLFVFSLAYVLPLFPL